MFPLVPLKFLYWKMFYMKTVCTNNLNKGGEPKLQETGICKYKILCKLMAGIILISKQYSFRWLCLEQLRITGWSSAIV